MKSLFRYLIPLLLPILYWTAANAQTQLTTTPNASPQAKVSQTIGITDVTVIYHRPSAKERDIWGQLVPQNVVWRAGANENTVIHFSTDVAVAGQTLAAGTYGLHLLNQDGAWTAIFSNNSTSWGSFSYNKGEDALRVAITPQKSPHFYEYLTFEFTNLDKASAVCALSWGDKTLPIPIAVDLENTVMANLQNELRTKPGWTWQGWNEAANFCLQNDVNLQQGINWATRSVFMSPNTQNIVTKARLAGKIKGGEDQAKALKVSLESIENDLTSHSVTWKEWHGAANFASQNKANDKALTWLDHSIDMSANMTNMMAKSTLLEAEGKKDKAAKYKKEALAKGSNAELNTYGYTLLFGGKKEEAVEVFKANADKHPEDPNVWDSLGEGYFNIGKKEEAVMALKKSLSLNPPANVKANSMKILQQMGVEIKP